MAKESRAKSAMGGKSGKRKGHPVHEMHIRRGKSGGFIVKHPKKTTTAALMNGADSEPDEHSVPDMDALQQHLQDHMGDQPSAGASPEEMQQAGPAAAMMGGQ